MVWDEWRKGEDYDLLICWNTEWVGISRQVSVKNVKTRGKSMYG